MRLSLCFLVLGNIFLNGCVLDKPARIFGNTTYFFNYKPPLNKATLVNGKHEEFELNVYYENIYIYGDFNRDGLKDAAVIITENNGGNADWYILAFLINDGKKMVHSASIALDDRAVINSVREKKGKVFIDMYVHQEGDSMGGPTKRVREIFEYPGTNNFSASYFNAG